MRVFSLNVLWALLLLFPLSALSQEESSRSYPLLDFDGDGTSDLTLMENQADGSTNELVFRSYLSRSSEYAREEFGSSDDHRALADYNGDGETDYTVVRDSSDSLEWLTSDESGNYSTDNYGFADEFMLAGCDFDGDGTADRAVYNGTSFYFSGAEGSQEIPVALESGETPSHATCGDFNDDGEWELLLVLETEAGSTRVAIFDLSGTQLFETTAREPVSIAVHDMNGDGLLDFSLFRRPRRKSFLITYSQGSGQSLSFTESKARLGRKVFNFTPLFDAESNDWSIMFIGKKNRLFNYDENIRKPRRNRDLILSGETLVQPTYFKATGGTVPEDPSGRCSSVEDMSDGGGGRLWKGAEHGGTVALFPRCDFTPSGRVEIWHNGELLYRMEDTGWANADPCGLRRHFRARDRSPGSFPSGMILMVTSTQGDTYCYQINENPGRRID